MQKKLLATIDLGSNSFRLLIAQINPDGTIVHLDKMKEIVRLTGGLDKNNYLSKEIQLKALSVLSKFNERLIGFTKENVRVVGTSAFRVAQNSNEFINLANKTLGFNIEVLSGNEEARIIYIGASHSLPLSNKRRLIIDIGGGSTEFILGTGFESEVIESVTMGCVSFSYKYFPDGDITTERFNNAIFAARVKIQTMEHIFINQKWNESFGSSGTVKSLQTLCSNLCGTEFITYESLCKIKKSLIKLKNIKNLGVLGVKEDRQPVIVGGLSILLAIFEELKIVNMGVAEWSLREGLIYDLLGRMQNQDLRELTVRRLKTIYDVELSQSERVADTACNIYSKLNPTLNKNENNQKLFKWAVELYEIGLNISHNDYHKHGAYILANSDMSGFSKLEQNILSDLVRSHRGNLLKVSSLINYKGKNKTNFYLMTFAFRLAVIIHRSRTDISKNVNFDFIIKPKNIIQIIMPSEWLNKNLLINYSIKEEVEYWEKINYYIELNTI